MAKQGGSILNLVLLGGAAYAGYEYYKKHERQHMGVETRELRLKLAGVHQEDHDTIISVKILNPTASDMEVKSFVGEMYANNKVVADIQMFGDYIAKANAQIEMPLIAKARGPELFKQLMAYMQNRGVVKFAGTINVNNHAIPVTLQYSTT